MFKLATKEAKRTNSVVASRFRQLMLDKQGVAGINFLLEVVIGVAIVAALITIVSTAIPNFWTTVMTRLNEFLS